MFHPVQMLWLQQYYPRNLLDQNSNVVLQNQEKYLPLIKSFFLFYIAAVPQALMRGS